LAKVVPTSVGTKKKEERNLGRRGQKKGGTVPCDPKNKGPESKSTRPKIRKMVSAVAVPAK